MLTIDTDIIGYVYNNFISLTSRSTICPKYFFLFYLTTCKNLFKFNIYKPNSNGTNLPDSDSLIDI